MSTLARRLKDEKHIGRTTKSSKQARSKHRKKTRDRLSFQVIEKKKHRHERARKPERSAMESVLELLELQRKPEKVTKELRRPRKKHADKKKRRDDKERRRLERKLRQAAKLRETIRRTLKEDFQGTHRFARGREQSITKPRSLTIPAAPKISQEDTTLPDESIMSETDKSEYLDQIAREKQAPLLPGLRMDQVPDVESPDAKYTQVFAFETKADFDPKVWDPIMVALPPQYEIPDTGFIESLVEAEVGENDAPLPVGRTPQSTSDSPYEQIFNFDTEPEYDAKIWDVLTAGIPNGYQIPDAELMEHFLIVDKSF